MSFEGFAILIFEENILKFKVIRGPPVFESLSKFLIPASEQTLIEPFFKERQVFYLADLQTEGDLLSKIQNTVKIPYKEFTFLRSWLSLPWMARGELVGVLVLAHSQPDQYSSKSRNLSRAYASQVAIAIQNAQLYEQAGDVATLEERNRLDELVQLSKVSDGGHADVDLRAATAHPGKRRTGDCPTKSLVLVEARPGTKVDLQLDGEFTLSKEFEGELNRIAQEALNNVIKHARTDRVNVLLKGEAGSFMMTIEDNGIGFDPETTEQAEGQGIRSIRERVEKIGARCWIESAPGWGAKISIEVNQDE